MKDNDEITSLIKQKKAMMEQYNPDNVVSIDDIDMGYKLPRTASRGQMNTPLSVFAGATLLDISKLSLVVITVLFFVSVAFNSPSSSF